MKAPDPSRAWRTLLETQSLVPITTRANSAVRRLFPDADRLVQTVLESFCIWEAGPHRAELMLERLADLAVDPNDLRVCLEHEIAAALAPVDPRAPERAHHLRRSLGDLALRSPTPTLATLEHMPVQDAVAVVRSFDGMFPFVATRVLLMLLEVPAIPLDDRLRAALDEIRAIPAGMSMQEASAWLARAEHATTIRPADAYELLERWAEAGPEIAPGAAKKASASRASPRRAPAKTTPRAKKGPKAS